MIQFARSAFCSISASLFVFAAGGAAQTGQGGLPSVDSTMQSLLTQFRVPGGSLAIAYNGKLIYARGYGLADTNANTPVQPDSLFREASISKTFTAVAILKLYDEGKIGLDDEAFAYLADLQPPAEQIGDPRIANITIRELLNHTGGWDRSVAGDPVANAIQIAMKTGAPLPGSADWFIGYMWTQKLQNDPGKIYAYSNVGYVVLGSLIEHVTGMRYEDYVRQAVLTPLGISRTFLADSSVSDAANGEVTYYDYPGTPCVESLIPYFTGCVPSAYANHDFAVAEAAGGWVTTPIELMRFLLGFPGLFKNPDTLVQMQTAAAAFAGKTAFYGLGFNMQPDGNGFDWAKDGSLDGTSTFLHRRPNGFMWAANFNSRSQDGTTGSAGDEGGSFETAYVTQLEAAFGNLTAGQLPGADQFPNYPSTLLKPEIASVVQAATGGPAIVPGSWATIYGTNLSAASRLWFPSEFRGGELPIYVDHVTVTIGGEPAAIHYVSPGQVNVQVPANLPNGPVTVILSHDGQSAQFQATAAALAPGFFTYAAGGETYAASQHTSDYSGVGVTAVTQGTRPAAPGEILAFYGSGFAPTPAGTVVSSTTTLPGAPAVTIGGKNAQATSVFVIGAGLFQINVTVPDVSAGNQPVTVTYNGVTSPAGVSIPVEAQ